MDADPLQLETEARTHTGGFTLDPFAGEVTLICEKAEERAKHRNAGRSIKRDIGTSKQLGLDFLLLGCTRQKGRWPLDPKIPVIHLFNLKHFSGQLAQADPDC